MFSNGCFIFDNACFQNINPIKKKQLGQASPVGTLLYQWLVLGWMALLLLATVTSLKNCIFYNCRLKIVHNEQRMKVIAPSNTTQ
jgi:hypothetical protein